MSTGRVLFHCGELTEAVGEPHPRGCVGGVSLAARCPERRNESESFLPGEDPGAVLGLTYPFAPSSSVLYHKIFINPDLWPTLSKAAVGGAEGSGATRYMTAVAIMSLTHGRTTSG